jgi:two-component sensor histidine kinase
MESGRAVAIPNIYEDDRIPQDAYRPTFVQSLAMVPVRQERPIAALGAYWSRCYQASDAELDLLQTVANVAALPIAYVQLRDTQRKGGWRRLVDWFSLSQPRNFDWRAVWNPSSEFVRSQRIGAVVLGLAFVAAALIVRMPLNSVVGREVPYATFYVAVMLATLWRGWLAGAVALIAGGLTANTVLVEPIGNLSLSAPHIWSLLVYAAVAGVLLIVTNQLVSTTNRERNLNKKLELIRGELQHRIKNSLTVVQALAVQTARSSTDTVDFDAKFSRRLQALAGAQSLIHQSPHSATGLALIIERTLAPFDLADGVKMNIPSEVRIGGDAAIGLALVLNELATNALKYGALTSPTGRVLIECDLLDGRARVHWCERGGPAVLAPSEQGFGTRLIRSALSQSNGKAEIEYRQDGLTCKIQLPCLAD